MKDTYGLTDQGQRYLQRGRTRFIERTKDFYVKEGCETEPSYIEAIRKRGSMGDRINH